ncbi:hypothetical protein ACFOEE_00170 [Pseudoalteromonas fenneropenaei]|uniref:Lipoprotein n=1 Tax=Pseudoalteromonas fenneropenaei TaxID=1737459 RepID=A0ABV7CEC9_9GAMM
MKRISLFMSVVVLAGCKTTDYASFAQSNALLNNVVVNEEHNAKYKKHVLDVAFDYQIEGFHADQNLYHCTVQFANIDGTTTTSYPGKIIPCKLEQAAGHVAISWPMPLDKQVRIPQTNFTNLKYPIEYMVVIHQRTGAKSSRIIGQSAQMVSTLQL